MTVSNNNSNGNDDSKKSNSPKPPPKRRKRGGGGRSNNKRSGGGKGPPQPPQLKVTVRNIQNADMCGTVRKVGDMIAHNLVRGANAKLMSASSSTSGIEKVTLKLEENGLNVLADADDAARAARAEWEAKQDPNTAKEKTSDETVEEEQEGKEGDGAADTAAVEAPAKDDILKTMNSASKPEKLVEGMEQLAVSSKPVEHDDSCVSVRVLYAVPPKKTKRRGMKPGCLYLVLSTPVIEARTALPVQPEHQEGPRCDTASTVSSKTDTVSTSAVDYSVDVARRRLMIQRSMDALNQTVQDAQNSKTYTPLADCKVEESLNGKTWKARWPGTTRRDRVEGTLQDTADYKSFLESSEKDKEERKTRPKPAPGGGVAAVISAANDTNGQPVAAIVTHLLKKKEEEKKRKQQAKKKAKEGTKKGNNNNGKDSSAPKNEGGKKNKRKNNSKKKKAPPKATSASANNRSVAS